MFSAWFNLISNIVVSPNLFSQIFEPFSSASQSYDHKYYFCQKETHYGHVDIELFKAQLHPFTQNCHFHVDDWNGYVDCAS